MKAFLQEFLPRFFPNLQYLCVAHEGKQDLEKSLRRKLPAWQVPTDRFVVIRDNDGGDCLSLKSHLKGICDEAGVKALIRIACQELEAWYLGDFEALSRAFDDDTLVKHAAKKKFRNPDRLGSPSQELKALIPSFQKMSGARMMGRALTLDKNCSPSFGAFVKGIQAQQQ